MADFSILLNDWQAPEIIGDVPHGDMPGDSVVIKDEHISKLRVLFPALKVMLYETLCASPYGRAVVSICGGSGVGKSETASLLSYELNRLGIGAYTMSGDNYPHRIPAQNDEERLRVFRHAGTRALACAGYLTPDMQDALRALWADGTDADPAFVNAMPWLEVYQKEGRCALSRYLGTELETDFAQVSELLSAFHQGAQSLMLKRMGRTPDALWYDCVNMCNTHVLVLEWTHGNSDLLHGVDIPILLNATPAETLAHRRARARDKGVDSPFTTMVLQLEHAKLEMQAHKARIILSRSNDLLDYATFRKAMA